MVLFIFLTAHFRDNFEIFYWFIYRRVVLNIYVENVYVKK